ncbi:hypothetical protein BOP97_03175 [Campylobacter coli]|nr:hypothetical protein BOP97_03175 [Campylobacter coli]
MLLKQNMVYPKSFLKGNQHWWIVDLACDTTLNKIDDFRKIILNGDYLSVINEINQYRDKRFIFSSEGICRNCFCKEHIYNLRNIFKIFGFNKIYVVLYIREISEFIRSYSVQNIQGWVHFNADKTIPSAHPRIYSFDLKRILEDFSEVFGRENLIVRLFDKYEFYQRDLLKDFIYSINLKWDEKFIIPQKRNKSLDLLGIELQRRINKIFPHEFHSNPPYIPIKK